MICKCATGRRRGREEAVIGCKMKKGTKKERKEERKRERKKERKKEGYDWDVAGIKNKLWGKIRQISK